MEQALIDHLLASAGVTALTAARIWWSERPQNNKALPAIVLHRLGGAPGYTMGGPSALTESRVQIDCLAETIDGAKLVRSAVKDRLSGATFTGVDGCFLDGEFDGVEAQGADAPERIQRVSLDFMIWHTA